MADEEPNNGADQPAAEGGEATSPETPETPAAEAPTPSLTPAAAAAIAGQHLLSFFFFQAPKSENVFLRHRKNSIINLVKIKYSKPLCNGRPFCREKVAIVEGSI